MLDLRPAALVLVAACSSGSTTSAPGVPVPVIELGELTVSFEGNPIARLHADGRTESVGDRAPGPNATFSPGPTLHADGTITFTRPGRSARVAPGGDIFVTAPGRPEQLYGHLSGDQILAAGSRHRGVRLDGAKLLEQSETAYTELGVIDPPALGHTALVMTAAFLLDTAPTIP